MTAAQDAPSSAPAPAAAAPDDLGPPPPVPDTVGQEKGEDIDETVPRDELEKLPVVGLGGSAGGLPALQAFFGAMASDCGMAFVVIMHLSPEHDSILADVLQRCTTMRVQQVRDRIRVEANQVYVIPPAKHLLITDGHLILTDLVRTRPTKHVAVDLFFRTLADVRGPHAAAIVLSGANKDGALGLKRIKERGGLTIAQDPAEAECDSMPRATIATGMVDWVLPAAEMPAKLCDYWRTQARLRLPSELEPTPLKEEAGLASDETNAAEEAALRDILGFLRKRTGRDFAYYKRGTILRRIARRMQVNGIEAIPCYLAFLRTNPGEAGALLQDLLISVTNFFRDREAFQALEAMVPSFFQNKGPDDCVRVWCAGCATGEEAFSVAILLHEYAETLDHPPTLQVFATDLDEGAIQRARDGSYLETISADVSEDRLRRFFTKGHGNYRVKREVRECVLFAVHDLLKDSPFSRLDLVVCRNLLIYLRREAQERALDIFHFALHSDGVLFLGSSESVDEVSPLFAVTDKQHRVYTRHPSIRPRPAAEIPGPSEQAQIRVRRHREATVIPRAISMVGQPVDTSSPERSNAVPRGDVSWSEVHAQAIESFHAPSIIVNQGYELVHLCGDPGRFLRFVSGEATTNLLRVVHPMLRIELRAALLQAAQSGVVAETFGVPVDIEGQQQLVDLRVVPTLPAAPGFLLVIFSERKLMELTQTRRVIGGNDAEPAIRELERELEQSKFTLRDVLEQSEADKEELKAFNEELQAMNKELRSTTEELETGREELQSINKGLSTVNQELKSKVEELSLSNSDLQNLMAATSIPTVFLDRTLRIQRYTPSAVALFNLIPTDAGRPLSNLSSQLNYPNLAADAEHVLETFELVQREVSHPDRRTFLARMRPYRADDDRVDGVVLTFLDISERKVAENERSRLLSDAQAARDEAEMAGAAKDHFLAVLSHELRTPLTPVLMAVNILARNPEVPDSALKDLEMIERNVQIESRFIDDLLDLTKINRGVLEIVPGPLNLREVLRRAVEFASDDTARKKQPVTVTLEASRHQVEGDATRLQQVFWNLLKNASKFTPAGGTIRVTSRNEPGRIVVEISDTGIGFEPQDASRLFEPFTRRSQDVARKFGGLGLGLAIAKAVVAAHGGVLRARSEGSGRGATFTVDLPLSE